MTTKIAVSLPDEAVATAKRAVREGRSPSVSAFVAAAIADAERSSALADLLAELDAEYGPVDPESSAWAKQALGDA